MRISPQKQIGNPS